MALESSPMAVEIEFDLGDLEVLRIQGVQMGLIVTNLGELQLLRKMLSDTVDNENYLLKLYKNNYTPISSSVLSNFTEADFTNYSEKILSRTDWSTPSVNGSGAGQSSVSAQSWTCGASGNTVYGYYVEGEDSGVVLWAEKFSDARNLALNDVINVTPVFTLNSEN